jgi:hypothetical protein
MASLPTPKPSPLAREAQQIKDQVDTMIQKMQKNEKFSPKRENLDELGELIIDYIAKNHTKAIAHHSYLKGAVIDLTEVPEMAPQMQRIAYLTALKDASHQIELYLSCL